MTARPSAFGKYELIERLAEGGMAEVYKARSRGVEGFEKILVVKRIRPELGRDARFVEMFIAEAKTAVTLSHANIVQVFDLGCVDDTYFIAMEYVAGMDLGALLRRARVHGMPLSAGLSVYIASEVVKGLDYAHRRRDSRMQPLGLVHRDVSPDNILLSYEGEVKLADFGIARAFDAVGADAGGESPEGKLRYMSPEQARGQEVDASSDLYSLGLVLYEMLAGRRAFDETNPVELVSRVQLGQTLPLKELNPAVADDLAALVHRILAPERPARHASASKLYEELIQFLFASGRRMGAYELSKYLDELREAAERSGGHAALSVARAGVDALQRTGAGTTAVESPIPRGQGASVPPVAGREASDHGTVAVFRFRPDDSTSDTALRSLVRRFGGVIVRHGADSRGRFLVTHFIGSEFPGRDTEAAARCALRVARLAEGTGVSLGAPSVSAVLHAALIPLASDGRPDPTALDRELEVVFPVANGGGAGEVLATRSAERSLRGRFQIEPLPDVGMPLYRVLGERNVTEALGRFVGRREELKRIGEVLALATRGKRRTLVVAGAEGSGKSRLLHETIRRLRLGNHPVGMYLVRLSPSDAPQPFSAVRAMLRAVTGIDALDPDPLLERKVDRLRELGLTVPEIDSVRVNLGLRASGPAAGSLRPLRRALSNMVRKLAEDCLTVVAFDGARAIDAASSRLLREVMEDARRSRVVFLFTYRALEESPWRGMKRAYEVEVGPLPPPDAAELVRARLRAETLDEGLEDEVRRVASGGPLHIEEYLRALDEAGAVRVSEGHAARAAGAAGAAGSTSLRALLRTRAESLDPSTRSLLGLVAVAAGPVGAAVLAAASGDDLVTVQRALGMLEQQGWVARHGASEVAVVSETVQDLLVRLFAPDALKAAHHALAAALERTYPQRVDALAERIAGHHALAGEAHRAAELWVRAADRLESDGALDGAVEALRAAATLWNEAAVPDRERALATDWRAGLLALRAGLDGEMIGAIRLAVERAESLGRDDYLARYAMIHGRMLVATGRVREGREELARARRVARSVGSRELLRDIMLASAEANLRNGTFVEDDATLEEALSLSRDTGDVRAQVRCLLTLSLVLAAKGSGDEARARLDEASGLLGMHPERAGDVSVLGAEAMAEYLLGNDREALASALRALELSREYDLAGDAAELGYLVGLCQLGLGETKAAFSSFRASHELATLEGIAKVEKASGAAMGFLEASVFGMPDGRERLDVAAEHATTHGHDGDALQVRFWLALLDAARGAADVRARFLEIAGAATLAGNRRLARDAEAEASRADARRMRP